MSGANSGKYSVSPAWADVTPIPLSDSSSANPAAVPLATIAYSARYAEAMSYLRAVMAANELSARSLALTEDIIGMNPAHYTVWLYRYKVLLSRWATKGEAAMAEGDQQQGKAKVKTNLEADADDVASGSSSEAVVRGVYEELRWLEGVAVKNLKNYQIWHHRSLLMTHLTSCPPTEIPFLSRILSLDAKNYHVWTYRQQLCRRFPEQLLPPPTGGSGAELTSVEKFLREDVRNNSAWNHRWFLVWGADDLARREEGDEAARMQKLRKQQQAAAAAVVPAGKEAPTSSSTVAVAVVVADVVDEEIVEREIAFTQAAIAQAPQNQSAWNYLRAVVKRAGRSAAEFQHYCEGFVDNVAHVEGAAAAVDTSSAAATAAAAPKVTSSWALEWLADIFEAAGQHDEASRCWRALAAKWDPIRKNYWFWRIRCMDASRASQAEEDEERDEDESGGKAADGGKGGAEKGGMAAVGVGAGITA